MKWKIRFSLMLKDISLWNLGKKEWKCLSHWLWAESPIFFQVVSSKQFSFRKPFLAYVRGLNIEMGRKARVSESEKEKHHGTLSDRLLLQIVPIIAEWHIVVWQMETVLGLILQTVVNELFSFLASISVISVRKLMKVYISQGKFFPDISNCKEMTPDLWSNRLSTSFVIPRNIKWVTLKSTLWNMIVT